MHYDCMTIDDIKRLPVGMLADTNCALFMWITDPLLKVGFEVLEAWGFQYKTVGFYWTKTNRKSPGYFMGQGYYTRANCEQCLLATRGTPKRKSRGVRKLIVSPRREHSRKPDETHERIETLFRGPYLELFGRALRPGWDTFGNEAEKFETKYLTGEHHDQATC